MLPSARFVGLIGYVLDFVGVPELGTSSSIPLNGTLWGCWTENFKYTCVALEYGTYAPDNGLRAMQADHWLHNQGEVDWLEPKTQTIKVEKTLLSG